MGRREAHSVECSAKRPCARIGAPLATMSSSRLNRDSPMPAACHDAPRRRARARPARRPRARGRSACRAQGRRGADRGRRRRRQPARLPAARRRVSAAARRLADHRPRGRGHRRRAAAKAAGVAGRRSRVRADAGGGYAEYCTTPAGWCLPIPNGLSLVEAASLPETSSPSGTISSTAGGCAPARPC